jgi:hypothetical protein
MQINIFHFYILTFNPIPLGEGNGHLDAILGIYGQLVT